MNQPTYQTVQTFSAFAIPVALIGVSGLTKKILRGTAFRWDDFYLGVDLTLAAFSAAAVNVLEMPTTNGANAAWYICVTFILFMLQIAFHQDWARTERAGKKQVLLLGFGSNVVGVALLGFFIYFKIEGKL